MTTGQPVLPNELPRNVSSETAAEQTTTPVDKLTEFHLQVFYLTEAGSCLILALLLTVVLSGLLMITHCFP